MALCDTGAMSDTKASKPTNQSSAELLDSAATQYQTYVDLINLYARNTGCRRPHSRVFLPTPDAAHADTELDVGYLERVAY